jgi:hypothetical protein
LFIFGPVSPIFDEEPVAVPVGRFAVFSDFRQAGSCIPTSASSRVAPFVSGGCASEPLRGWFLIFGKPKAAFPPPPPVASLLSSPVAVPVGRFADGFRFPASRTTGKMNVSQVVF